MNLENKIETGKAKICVIGLGYTGLPLAVSLAEAGYMVAGYDVDKDRIAQLQQGESYIQDVPTERVNALVKRCLFFPTNSVPVVSDIIFICVPTPLDETDTPDLSCVIKAAESIPVRAGQLIVLQSTTYPGTTEEVVKPILGRVGHGFHLAYSPERINPGDGLKIPPRIVGGVTPKCAELAVAILSKITPQVHIVSSPRVAEMAKLYENIFRAVNIAFANEMALLCDEIGMDIWEVIEAASTKPFGFMPFYPGPGVGGHCIPVNPHYLRWIAQECGFSPRLVKRAIHINETMPHRVMKKIEGLLGDLYRKRVLILGVAFKENVDDIRNSPGLHIMALLKARGVAVSYNDPYVPKAKVWETVFGSQNLDEDFLASQDCVVIVTPHDCYDFQEIARQAPLVIDTRNVLGGEGCFYKVMR